VPDPEHQDQQDAGHEFRQYRERHACGHDYAILPQAHAKGGVNPGADRSRHDDDQCDRRQQQRSQQGLHHERRHRGAENAGCPEITPDCARNPVQILGQRRLVRAKLVVQYGDCARIRQRPQNAAADIARQHPCTGKYHHAQDGQR
jgi:hypothetical protein